MNIDFVKVSKKMLLLLVFSLCVNTLYAQIQTTILGCKLGVSTKSTVEQVLRQKGLNLIRNDEASTVWNVFYDTDDRVLFGGIYWDFARIGFVDGKFSSILFWSKDAPRAMYDNFLHTLKSKYTRYLYTAYSDNSSTYFRDAYNNIYLTYNNLQGLNLSYGNTRLQEKAIDPFGGNGSNTSGTGDL